MPIGIVCPSCAARYRVPDQYAGKSATCKKCQTRIPVPASEHELHFRDDDASESIESMRSATMAALQPSSRAAADPDDLSALADPEPSISAPLPRRVPQARPVPAARPVDDDEESEDAPERNGNGFRPVHPGPDPWTGLLILLYLTTLAGVGLFNQYSLGRQASDLRAATPVGGLWTNTILQGVLFFILVAPLAMVGVYAASQILRFALAPSAYLKAAGVAAAPLVGVGVTTLIIGQFLVHAKAADGSSPLVGMVSMAGIIGGLALAAVLLKNGFGLNWAEAGAAFAMAALLGGIGIGLQGAIGDSLSRTITTVMKFKPSQSSVVSTDKPAMTKPNIVTDTPATPAADDALSMKLAKLTTQAGTLTSAESLHSNSRETLASSLAVLQTQAAAIGDEVRARPELADRYAALLTTLKTGPTLFASVPSARPDSSLNEPIKTADLMPMGVPDSASDLLGDAVAVGPFTVTPPKTSTLDLSATAAALAPAPPGTPFIPTALSWVTPEGGRLTLAVAPKVDARQQQPWVRTQTSMQPAAGIFSVDDSSVAVATHDFASLNQLPVTHIASTGGAGMPFEQFISLQGNTWVTVSAQASDPAGFTAVAAAARSQHYSGTTARNPLTPAMLADHLGDDDESAVALLKRTGPSAEPVVIEKLHDRNVRVRRRAITVLGDIGSPKSILALAEVVRSNDTFCADAAKASLRKLAPKSMDATNEALLDLEGSNPQQQRSAMLKLAELKPDDARRPRIAAALEKIVVDGPLGDNSVVEAAGDALAVWAAPDTVRSLLPLLKDPATDLPRRHAVLMVFAKLKDPRTSYLVSQYMVANPNDAEAAKTSLLAMGSRAEVDVIRDLNSAPQVVRLDACEILSQIGGQKSINALGPLTREQSDVSVAAAAKSAMLTIKDRVAATSGGPTGLFDLGTEPKPAAPPIPR